jgi:midasin
LPKREGLLLQFFLCYFQWGDELAAPSPLFLEQSYDSAHLLQQINSQKMLEDVSINHSTLLNTDNWKHANQQYFKCLAMMQQLRQVSLKFNKDLGLEEVSSFVIFSISCYRSAYIKFVFML